MDCQNIFDLGEPTFVNDSGVKWWFVIEPKEDAPNVRGWLTELTDGKKEYVLVDHETGEVIYASQKFEDVCIHLDVVNFSKKDQDEQTN